MTSRSGFVAIAAAALAGALGCGARSELLTTEPSTTDDLPANCGPIHLDNLMLQAGCEIETPGGPVDAEGFVSVQNCPDCLSGISCGDVPYEPHRILALNRLGAGHVMGWCDTTLVGWLTTVLEVRRYLGGEATPRVATIGYYPCDPSFGDGVPGTTYLGAALPAEYGDGAALAADWDVLIACGSGADFGAAFAAAVLSFVQEHGGGFLAVSDYVCPGETPTPALAQMNAVIGEAGMAFEPLNLAWGNGEIDLECVPDYPAD